MRQKGIVYAKQYSSTCISLCVCLSVCLSICVFVPLCLSICHSLARAVSLTHSLSLALLSCSSLTHLPLLSRAHLSLLPSVCVCLSVYLSICLSVCLSVRISLSCTRSLSQLTSFTQSDYLRSLPQATVSGKLKDNQTRARQIPEPSRLPRSICFHLSGG